MEMSEGTQTMEMLKNFHIAASGSDCDDDNDGDANDCGDQVKDDVIEEYDEDEEACHDEPVSLGFVEKPRNSWSLLRQVFPSKAGGMPAWLDPVNLPSNRSRLCDICGEPLHFVMQWKRRREEASRRVGFSSVKVFRCQLPRSNPFYSSEPPRHDGTDKPLGYGAILCNWCGTWKGDKACTGCRRVRCCSEKHQAVHWQSRHRVACRQMSVSSGSADDSLSQGLIQSSGVQSAASNNLWPEFEIINEVGLYPEILEGTVISSRHDANQQRGHNPKSALLRTISKYYFIRPAQHKEGFKSLPLQGFSLHDAAQIMLTPRTMMETR